MPRGLISNENEINKIGKGGESVCTCWGEVLGPRTPIFEKNTWNFLRFFFEPAIFFMYAAPISKFCLRACEVFPLGDEESHVLLVRGAAIWVLVITGIVFAHHSRSHPVSPQHHHRPST